VLVWGDRAEILSSVYTPVICCEHRHREYRHGRNAVVIEHRPAVDETGTLVRQAQAGEPGALAELLAAHLPLLHNVIGRALNGGPDVDDLVQDTVLQVIRGLPALREPERFRSWVVSIAYRQVQQHQRSRREAGPAGPEAFDLPDPSADFAERTVSELLLSGQRRELAQATRWLEPQHRRLLALWWQEAGGELTRAELAEVLGVAPRHAAVRLQRMRRRLDAARIVVRALQAVERCPGLDDVVRNWDGGTGPVWRKRLFRHVRDCRRCARHEQGLVPPEQLLHGLSALALPVTAMIGLRSALDAGSRTAAGPSAAAGSLGPAGTGVLTRAAQLLPGKLVAAVAVVVAVGGIGYVVDYSPGPDRTTVTIVNPPPTPVLTGVSTADFYVAPGGSDQADGSRRHPYATLAQAVSVVRPGQTIALRGGDYRLTAAVTIGTSGTAGHRITVSNYRNEHPVIDASGVPSATWAITQQADYWTVQGLELKNSASHAYVCLACRYDVFQRLSIHDNVESSLTLRNDGTIGNQVLDSDFYGNHDPADTGEGGIGLGIKFGYGTGNVVRGNRAFDNADDGFNFGSFSSPVTVEGNWAYGNGVNRWNVAGWRSNGNGFTFGGGSPPAVAAHIVHNNAAWDNQHDGFSDQRNTAALEFGNNTAFRNGAVGFDLPYAAAALLGNVAVGNASPVAPGPAGDGSGNSWNGGAWPAGRFASADPAVAQGARRPDGSLPRTSYLGTGTGTGAALD
jgi:RNA polymerase sigma factor (sigma-70 family)